MIPYPKRGKSAKGALVLNTNCAIAVGDSALLPLARVAKEHLARLFGANSHITRSAAGKGGIILKLDAPRLKSEAYEVVVGEQAIITGGGYKGAAWGLVTLLQSARAEDGKVVIPRARIADRPYAQYRGLLMDLARQWHPIEVVRQAVVLCHWYKIGYLQLHLNDDQLWTFPSSAYPELGVPEQRYTAQQLRDLEVFATARGVTIVPEIEMPGHSGAMVRALPELVGHDPAGGNLCPGRESTYKVLETVIAEACKIFKSTPYFHIGADEVDKASWTQCKYCADYRTRHGIEDAEEHYRHFIVRMNEVVRSHGKQMIVWEGFKVAGKIRIPKNIIVMEFESLYELPQNLVAAGYKLINTSWQPLYVVNARNWPPEKILGWNMYRWEHFLEISKAYPNGIDVPPSGRVLGAQMCAWEQPADIEISSLRERLAAMSERVWEHKVQRSFADFSHCFISTDAQLTKLLAPED